MHIVCQQEPRRSNAAACAWLGVTFPVSCRGPGVLSPLPNPVPLCPNHAAHQEPVALSFPWQGRAAPQLPGTWRTSKRPPERLFLQLPSCLASPSGCKQLLDAAPASWPDPQTPCGTCGTLPAAVLGRCGATSSSHAPRGPYQHPTLALGCRDLCLPLLFGATESGHLGRGTAPNLLSAGNTSTNAVFHVLFRILENSDQVTTSQNKSCDPVVGWKWARLI